MTEVAEEGFLWVRGTTWLSKPVWLPVAWSLYAITIGILKRILPSEDGSSGATRSATLAGKGWLSVVQALHNAWLTIWSAIMFFGVTREVVRYGMSNGIECVFCTLDSAPVPHQVYYWMYIFYLSKFYELLDTVVLAVRQKPLTFFHVWHHSSVLLETWLWIDGGWTHAAIGVWFNTLVHTFMYSYFCASVLRIKVKWRKSITQMQIVQFVFSFLITIPYVMLQVRNNWQCKGTVAFLASMGFNLSYLALFLNFYRYAYANSGRKPTVEEEAMKSE